MGKLGWLEQKNKLSAGSFHLEDVSNGWRRNAEGLKVF